MSHKVKIYVPVDLGCVNLESKFELSDKEFEEFKKDPTNVISLYLAQDLKLVVDHCRIEAYGEIEYDNIEWEVDESE